RHGRWQASDARRRPARGRRLARGGRARRGRGGLPAERAPRLPGDALPRALAAPGRTTDPRSRGLLPARHDDRAAARLHRASRRFRQPDPVAMSAARTRIDPTTTWVIAGALDSIAVEMGHKLA